MRAFFVCARQGARTRKVPINFVRVDVLPPQPVFTLAVNGEPQNVVQIRSGFMPCFRVG